MNHGCKVRELFQRHPLGDRIGVRAGGRELALEPTESRWVVKQMEDDMLDGEGSGFETSRDEHQSSVVLYFLRVISSREVQVSIFFE